MCTEKTKKLWKERKKDLTRTCIVRDGSVAFTRQVDAATLARLIYTPDYGGSELLKLTMGAG